MTDETTLRISKDAEQKIDFQVKIESDEDLKNNTIVRFIIKVSDQYCIMLEATHEEDDTWSVNVPILSYLEPGSYDITVEVILDNYHFQPSKGQVEIIGEPKVEFDNEKGKKEDKKDEKKKDNKKINEASAGSVNGGNPSPNNALLTPEFEPKVVHKSKQQKTPEDEHVDIEKIADKVVPGEGEDYAQEQPPSFDPKNTAQKVIMNVLGTKSSTKDRIKTEGKGFLLKPKKIDEEIEEKNQKLRKALSELVKQSHI